jgi:4-hydroxy-3-polyprenylbenzoate decarboxylase
MPHIDSHQPQELLTQANAILGNGQLSLAKYLMITEDRSGTLDIHNIAAFLEHVLSRVDLKRDLHFQTRTTIDTLDYSGTGFNRGSKVVIAAADRRIRELGTQLPSDLRLPDGFSNPRIVVPGVLAMNAPRFTSESSRGDVLRFCKDFQGDREARLFPWLTLVDDSDFTASTLSNWLWVTFTRSNPAIDLQGIDSDTIDKHWGCRGPLVVDARIKPHHAPPLVEDIQVQKKVDALAAHGGAIAKYL